jgi:hypothetical protein
MAREAREPLERATRTVTRSALPFSAVLNINLKVAPASKLMIVPLVETPFSREARSSEHFGAGSGRERQKGDSPRKSRRRHPQRSTCAGSDVSVVHAN